MYQVTFTSAKEARLEYTVPGFSIRKQVLKKEGRKEKFLLHPFSSSKRYSTETLSLLLGVGALDEI